MSATASPAATKSAQHTPGPWTTVCNDVAGFRPIGDSGVRFVDVVQEGVEGWRGAICSCSDAEHIQGISLSERNANAALIAASPYLLASLIELVAVVRGESPGLLNEDSGGDAKLSMQIDAAIAKATQVAA